MYKWAKLTPQITEKLLQMYQNRDFSAITWWDRHKNKKENSDYYSDGLLDLQALWTRLSIRPDKEAKVAEWNKLIDELGIPETHLTSEDFPRYGAEDRHGIPSLKLDQMRSCRKNPEAISKLWELIESAKRIADGKDDGKFAEIFDDFCALKVPANGKESSVSPAFLSKILFISFPSVFVTIDSNTKNVFSSLKNVRNGSEYLAECENVRSAWQRKKPDIPKDEILIDFSVSAYRADV